MTVFFSQLINGLSLGSIYALIALGYSMVYGIILLLNFAHGDVIMVGAYMSWFVMNQLGLGPVTAVCATILTCTLLGVVIEKIAYTPLRSAPRISLLITAIGVSFFLEYTAELVMGSGAKVIPSYYDNKTFYLGKVPLGLTSIITLVVTVLSMLVLTFLVQKTKLGKAMRAVSEDMDAARLMGINVNSTISFTFAVGSALAGIGSVLYCCSYPQATPTMGSMLGLKAFVAAVLGGIGILPSKGLVVAPADATVSVIHSTLHALGLQLDDGTELLIHVGVDTVEMNGDGFHSFVKEGDRVKKGDKLLSFDIDKIKAAGHNTTVSVIVSNSDDFKAVEGLPGDPVDLNCSVIRTVH